MEVLVWVNLFGGEREREKNAWETYNVGIQMGEGSGAVAIGWDGLVVDVVLEWADLFTSAQLGLDGNAFSVLSGCKDKLSVDSVGLGKDGFVGDVGRVSVDSCCWAKFTGDAVFGVDSEDEGESDGCKGEELHCG